ncbi:hypothetical protein [Flammeovirga aprica]|uniref:Uncharacterized protein n=1 Tax=Flammeovirga aprica JL-4 TaxID=694437 RepID=A0A7X9RXG4_9BACT|nr:hypothetical protein [Flammeovirga aprica]NME70562.1 hypothetical protein [Flammeovirga aprica JL-4]
MKRLFIQFFTLLVIVQSCKETVVVEKVVVAPPLKVSDVVKLGRYTFQQNPTIVTEYIVSDTSVIQHSCSNQNSYSQHTSILRNLEPLKDSSFYVGNTESFSYGVPIMPPYFSDTLVKYPSNQQFNKIDLKSIAENPDYVYAETFVPSVNFKDSVKLVVETAVAPKAGFYREIINGLTYSEVYIGPDSTELRAFYSRDNERVWVQYFFESKYMTAFAGSLSAHSNRIQIPINDGYVYKRHDLGYDDGYDIKTEGRTIQYGVNYDTHIFSQLNLSRLSYITYKDAPSNCNPTKIDDDEDWNLKVNYFKPSIKP